MSIKHQDIIDKIKTKFETILIANGFYTDLGSNVYVNKANKLISSADVNAINIVDISASVVTAKSGGMVNYFDYDLSIEASLHFKGSAAASDIRKGIVDVQKIIGQNITWDGLAINTFPPDGTEFIELVFDQAEQIIVGSKINFVVEYRTKQWQEE